jgi:hypothetical protein
LLLLGLITILVDRLLLTGNAIVTLNEGELRQRLTPLLALSCT